MAGNAASIPATTMITRACISLSRALSTRWMPATPASYNFSTRLPSVYAATAASSATGTSAIPAHATNTSKSSCSGWSMAPTMTMRASEKYCACGKTDAIASNVSDATRVPITIPCGCSFTNCCMIATECAIRLPLQKTTSGKPFRKVR